MTDISSNDMESRDTDGENLPNEEEHAAEIRRLRSDYEARIVAAHLRTEAVRAGMIDLDGLKLIDLSEVQLGPDDKLLGSREIMESLKRTKPWLFGVSSSSSTAAAPSSKRTRPKTALEMTDEEYVAARASLIKRRY